MAYASPADRLKLRAVRKLEKSKFDITLLVRKNGRRDELPCDSLSHGMRLAAAWKSTHTADYVELFRVNPDGTLRATIGANVGYEDEPPQ